MSDDDGNEICCPKCQQWPCACRAKSLPCPFCQMNLTSVALDMRYASDVVWQHPPTGCLLDGLNVFGRELPKWNRRTPASAVLPEARSADTPTPLPAPDAGWRTIHSAPKDGRKIFLYLDDEGFSTEGRWREHEDGPGWYLPALDEWAGAPNQGFIHTCTHWLPLPAPPVGDEK